MQKTFDICENMLPMTLMHALFTNSFSQTVLTQYCYVYHDLLFAAAAKRL